MKTKKQFTTAVLTLALVLGMMPGNEVIAKKGVSLSSKKITIVKGKSKMLKVKNTKTKVKWKITSGKKNITMKKKGPQTVVLTGKKKGNAKVQAAVGKKKLVCKVVIKDAAIDTVKTTPSTNGTKQPIVSADKNSNITVYSADKKSAEVEVNAEAINSEYGKCLLLLLKNTGKEQIDRINFEIVLKDQAGKVIDTRSDELYAIAPGEMVWRDVTVFDDYEEKKIDITKTVVFKHTWKEDTDKYVNFSSELDVNITPDAGRNCLDINIKDNTGKGDDLRWDGYLILYDTDGRTLFVQNLGWVCERIGETITGQVDVDIDEKNPEHMNYKCFIHAYVKVRD